MGVIIMVLLVSKCWTPAFHEAHEALKPFCVCITPNFRAQLCCRESMAAPFHKGGFKLQSEKQKIRFR